MGRPRTKEGGSMYGTVGRAHVRPDNRDRLAEVMMNPVLGGPGLSTRVPDVPREPPERGADRGGLRGPGRLRPERRRPRPAPALPRVSGLARRRTRMVRRRMDGGADGERVVREHTVLPPTRGVGGTGVELGRRRSEGLEGRR